MNLRKISRPAPQIISVLKQLRCWCQGLFHTVSSAETMMTTTETADSSPLEGVDQRRHPRVPLQNVSVQVTDGCLFATATLKNISPDGLCLSNLPDQLYNHGVELTVYSSNNPGLPVLQIQPRWQENGWNGKTIGAAILNVAEAWRLFFIHTASQHHSI